MAFYFHIFNFASFLGAHFAIKIQRPFKISKYHNVDAPHTKLCAQHDWQPCSKHWTHSMEQSPSWEAKRFAVNQEVPRMN